MTKEEFLKELSEQHWNIMRSIERCSLDVFNDPNSNKYEMYAAISNGVEYWEKGMKYGLEKELLKELKVQSLEIWRHIVDHISNLLIKSDATKEEIIYATIKGVDQWEREIKKVIERDF